MLKRLMIGLAAALAFAVPAAAAPDWSKTVAATQAGGFRMGNPDAPVKLVEYGSLACPTCARFAADSAAPLLAKVKSGKLSFEFRNFVLNGPDIAATMLSRCAAPGDYFGITDRYFAQQSTWLGRIRALPESEMRRIAALPPLQQIAALAETGGLVAIAGVAPAKARACLADQAALDRIMAMRRTAAETHHVHGTPTFLVNGKVAEGVHSWSALAPLLAAAGG